MALEQDHHVAFGRMIEIGGDPGRRKYGRVGWNLCDYQKAVQQQLRLVDGNAVGRLVIGALAKKTIIVPDQNTEAYNATATPVGEHYCGDHLPAPTLDSTSAAQRPGFAGELTFSGQSHSYRSVGGGSRSVIQFTPGKFIAGSALNPKGLRFYKADEVLLHELVHSVRHTLGLLDLRPVATWLSDFKDKEEFLAVLIANMYRSAGGAKQADLRWEYETGPIAPGTEMKDMSWRRLDSSSFAMRYDSLICVLISEMPVLFAALARIACEFNPVALCLDQGVALDAATRARYDKVVHPEGG